MNNGSTGERSCSLQTLVLCDLDKTLIDIDQQATADGVADLAHALGKAGVTMGLASDSSHAKLIRWQTALGFNGPIIAERGAILQRSLLEPIEVLGPWEPYFQSFRADFLAQLPQQFPRVRIVERLAGGATAMRLAETQAAQTSGSNFQNREGNDSLVFFVNVGRRCGFATTAAMVRQGSTRPSAVLLEMLVRSARNFLAGRPAPDFPVYWDANPEYGSLIIGPEQAVKALAIRTLLERVHYDRVIMIGDSIHDHLAIEGVEQWAVANATNEYKRRCSRVATLPLTAGVIELLSTLLP